MKLTLVSELVTGTNAFQKKVTAEAVKVLKLWRNESGIRTKNRKSDRYKKKYPQNFQLVFKAFFLLWFKLDRYLMSISSDYSSFFDSSWTHRLKSPSKLRQITQCFQQEPERLRRHLQKEYR